MENTSIAILYICTGKYSVFWKDFYLSAENFLLKDFNKHYFVFTDDEELKRNSNKNITVIHQDQLGWPYDTLKRFHMFSLVIDELKKFDFIFFINANTEILTTIGTEILPDNENQLVACLHPGYHNSHLSKFPYEKNKKSLAYLPKKEGKYYFAGGLNGGTSNSYIKLITELKNNIDKDLLTGTIAVWHDESHINKYLSNYNDIKILDSGYLFPEGWNIPFEKKIVVKNKANYGGHNLLRNIPIEKTKTINSLIQRIWRLLKR